MSGRPIGGVLPFWLNEVTPQLWIIWHSGFIVPMHLEQGYLIGVSGTDWAMLRKNQWLYHIQNSTGLVPKPIAILVRLACEMVASMK
jgi:hypothetical protein